MSIEAHSFFKAKLDHYTDRAEELVRMARYPAARAVVNSILELAPDFRRALGIQKNVADSLEQLNVYSRGEDTGFMVKKKEIVLVVDQEERVLTALITSLRKYGFFPIGAANFDEAIEILREFKPSLTISEVNFENGSVGLDLYFWLRNNSALSLTPFLYLATRVTREMLIAGKRMGVDEFITKPLDEEVVMASVLNCLSRKKKRLG